LLASLSRQPATSLAATSHRKTRPKNRIQAAPLPNNSFKPSPLRGLGAGGYDSAIAVAATLPGLTQALGCTAHFRKGRKMFELIGIAVVLWIVWKVIKAVARTATTQAYQQGEAESLSLPAAQTAFEEAEADFIGAMSSPNSTSAAEQQRLLDRAVFLKDRVNQLSGGETGSAYRAKYRDELIAEASHLAPVLSGDIETIRSREKQRIFASYETWLEIFKVSASGANDDLDTGDDDPIMDHIVAAIDQTPLREAYKNGVDPYRFGADFGENFDLEEFFEQQKSAT
jgi:hypothetical protein